MAAMAAMATVLPAGAHAEETIDAFARAHLKASQQAQDARQAQARTNGASAGNPQAHAPEKPARADVPPELLFIYGVENAVVAYLRVDGRFGRNVVKGDKVGEWQVVNIGDDYVDLRHGARAQRLLLPNAFGDGPSPAMQTSHRAPGRLHGDDS
uniref:Type IV pilus biogenesis protein PilP n=2 Tax=Pandoraea faecigallinarum TaxID=656179 RepID=A0A0H3WVV7_9BURK